MSTLAHEAGLVLQRREKGTDARSTASRLAGHGLSAEARDFLVENESQFETLKPGLPADFTPLAEGDTVATGDYSWRVIFGQGHAPDHVCLYCADPPPAEGGAGAAVGAPGARPGILISGDMVLPHISTHVGSPAAWLPGNPVALFQDSVRRLAELPQDTLVLPSHGEPFVGLRERVVRAGSPSRGAVPDHRGSARRGSVGGRTAAGRLPAGTGSSAVDARHERGDRPPRVHDRAGRPREACGG